jgi:hypothetical protein
MRFRIPEQLVNIAHFQTIIRSDAQEPSWATATMKCQIVEIQPAAGGSMKVVGAAHPTRAPAETALTGDKTCK